MNINDLEMVFMANFEKIVKVTDAVLNCIPIVSSISNTAQLIYKLAHKTEILNRLLPSANLKIAFEKRIQLFEVLIGRWKDAITAQAHKLYIDVSDHAEYEIEISQSRFDNFPETVLNYPSIESLRTAHGRCKDILPREFPGCDKEPVDSVVNF